MKIKKCVFIFVPDKKALDCKIIESPENEMRAEAKLVVSAGNDGKKFESSLQPLVTSIMPVTSPFDMSAGAPKISRSLPTGKASTSSTRRSIKISQKQ